MDKFFCQRHCDRCGKDLKDGRIMSIFNRDCICLECKEKERLDQDYPKAVQADIDEIKKGNFNFQGIGR